MNTQLFIIAIVLGFSLLGLGQAFTAQAINEDQFEICDFQQECIVINADDYLDDETIEKIWLNFKYDLDTYPRD